jgi:hypothetical protein
MSRPRGRRALDTFDQMEQEGFYIFARYDLGRRLDRKPTLDEIAEYMDLSPRSVETIRARTRAWQAETARMLGWDTTNDIDYLDSIARWTRDDDTTLGLYALGEITTAEAADRLGRADERTLRRWRNATRQS